MANNANQCQTYLRPVLKGYGVESNVLYLVQPSCRMWSCKPCAIRNQQFWSMKISEGIEWYKSNDVGNWRFITITSHKKNKTFSQTVYVWPKAWKKLANRMRYKYQGIRYVLLPEQHKDGRLHVHALASGGITHKWLKKACTKSGLGWRCESKYLGDSLAAIGYVTKYLAKSLQVIEWPPKFRRIRTTTKWPPLESRADFEDLNVEWSYLATYPNDGLEYLAQGLKKKHRIDVVIL